MRSINVTIEAIILRLFAPRYWFP